MFSMHVFSLDDHSQDGLPQLSDEMLGRAAPMFCRELVYCHASGDEDHFYQHALELVGPLLTLTFKFETTYRELQAVELTDVIYIEESDQVVGCCLIVGCKMINMVQGMAVHPAFRGKGLGSALVGCLPLLLSKQKVGLCVDRDTDATERLVQFYERFEFEVTPDEEDAYSEADTEIFMRKRFE